MREWNKGRMELGRWGFEGFKILIDGLIFGGMKKEMFVEDNLIWFCELFGFCSSFQDSSITCELCLVLLF